MDLSYLPVDSMVVELRDILEMIPHHAPKLKHLVLDFNPNQGPISEAVSTVFNTYIPNPASRSFTFSTFSTRDGAESMSTALD
jgi:hypothetical protein